MPGRPQKPFQRPQCPLEARVSAAIRVQARSSRLDARNMRATTGSRKNPEESSGVTALIKTSLLGRNLKWLPVVEHELMACPPATTPPCNILATRFAARERAEKRRDRPIYVEINVLIRIPMIGRMTSNVKESRIVSSWRLMASASFSRSRRSRGYA